MNCTFRTLALAATLVATLAPVALAGGMSASIEGPAKDGTYLVQTYSCNSAESMRPSGWAEGVVKGERRTIPLQIQPSKQDGSYTFQRTWPADGHWLVRLTFANSLSPALVAQLGHDGRVAQSKWVWKSDGKHECEAKLAAAAK